MKTEIRKVDPKLAEQWLTQSASNRPLRRKHVLYLANEMGKGHWRLTHQGIAFAPDSTLMDGQHRLEAIKESGKPVMLQVSYYENGDNLDFAFPILDRGLVRNISDITQINSNIIGMYNILFQLGKQKNRIPPDDYVVLDNVLGKSAREFLAQCPYHRTYYTLAAVKAAGLTAFVLQKSPLPHIARLFKEWATASATAPISLAFINYVPNMIKGKGHLDLPKLFSVTIYALLKKNESKSRIFLSEEFVNETVHETQDMVSKAMKGELKIISETERRQREEIIRLKNSNKILIKTAARNIQAEQSELSMAASD